MNLRDKYHSEAKQAQAVVLERATTMEIADALAGVRTSAPFEQAILYEAAERLRRKTARMSKSGGK